MKKNLFALLLVATVIFTVAVSGLSSSGQRERSRDRDSEDSEFSEKDEFHQTYQLSAGARVEVRGINGAVEIETAPGSTAEVNVVRSARTREDLEFHKVLVEQTATSLVVQGEKDHSGSSRGHNVRQHVTLRLPRQVDLAVSGINGRATVGQIDGPVKLSGINGRVEVAQAMGYSDISGINGQVKMTISQLGERGIHVSGVNGGVELFFAEDLNADLDVTGINGSVNPAVANVTVLGKIDRQNFHAKIGAGGSPIKVSGVNGHVKLSRVGAPG
ncbi:MAG TPA: hypothetical protein VKF81_06910 [Blastocatellia bacterium]|nr:hypothetical protein [Blastocatellia bacterium]